MAAIYYSIALTGCGYAIWRGSASERVAAIVFLAGSFATTLIGTASKWNNFEAGIFAVDCLVLASFWTISIKSDKFWPYWVTGWQLVGVMVHIQKALLPGITATPYGYLSLVLCYPMLILIVMGSMLNTRSLPNDITRRRYS